MTPEQAEIVENLLLLLGGFTGGVLVMALTVVAARASARQQAPRTTRSW